MNCLLVSMNYEVSKGGISRVARLIAEAIQVDLSLSLHGKVSEHKVRYFNGNRFNFSIFLLKIIFLQAPTLIVFDHIGPASLLFFVPRFFLKNKKIIVFLHDEEAWSEVSGRHRYGLVKATHLLCNSEYTYRKFIQSNPSFKDKTKVCLLGGIPLSFYNHPGQINKIYEPWFKSERPFCLFVSRLWKEHRYKGYWELLNGFKIYYERNPNARMRLAIIGQGNDAGNIQSFLQEQGLENNISLFTGVDDGSLPLFYEKCQAFLFPSTREGFGFVFLEAMFFNKACIGMRGQPAEEIISDNESGILLNDHDGESVAALIADIEKFPDKYLNYGLQGKRIFNEKFSNDFFKKRFLKCIE
jgi:phosphatidylinositol alpha-1,6-mannosyltransferase